MINPEKIETYLLEYSELNKLVNENFQFMPEFEYISYTESNNDSDHLYLDILKVSKYPWEQDDLDKFLNGRRDFVGVHTILRALVQKEVIPEGNYLIEVTW